MALSSNQINTVINKASHALADYCYDAGIHVTVTGVSGGLDSAVTIFLSQKACEINIHRGFQMKSIGLILPCNSDPSHSSLGKKVVASCEADLLEIDLSGIFNDISKEILSPISDKLNKYLLIRNKKTRYDTAQGNVKARLRMSLGTYYVANMTNGLVLSTDNYSEYWMGFWTLHGDVGDFGMIQEIWKGDELIQIAKRLKIPNEVISAPPTDGLGISPGGDEAQLGAPYPIVDKILQSLLSRGISLNGSLDQLDSLPHIDDIDPKLVKKIASRALLNSFKRSHPKNLSRKHLGLELD